MGDFFLLQRKYCKYSERDTGDVMKRTRWPDFKLCLFLDIILMLYTHMHIHIYMQNIFRLQVRDDTIITSGHCLLEKYTSHFICKVCVWEEVETEQNCNILTPTFMAISVVSFSFFRVAKPEARGPTLLGAGFLYRILSPTGLISKLTHFLSSPRYIIVQSPTIYISP